MPNQPKTQHRSVRVPDDTWSAAMARTAADGTSVGEIVRGFLDWWLRKPGAKLPRRPESVTRSAGPDHGQSPPHSAT